MTDGARVDPLRVWRARHRATLLLAAPVVALMGWWAFAEVRIKDGTDLAPEPASAATASDPRDARPDFDARVFARRLTPAPPPPPPPAPPADVKPAFPFELVCIFTRKRVDGDAEGDGYSAALYDSVGARLRLVSAGDSIGDVTVERVLEREVTLSRGNETRRLAIVRKDRDPRVLPGGKGGVR